MIAEYTVGCVPYVNAIPLVFRFEQLGEQSPVRVLYDVPSRLPEMLDSGEADAVLVSSIDALHEPGRRMAAGICIGSHGPVKSVRLFSKVEPHLVRSLALDASSMTSNRLAQLVLAERYHANPSVVTMRPDLASMLAVADACVLIGDIGMAADGARLWVLDLGQEWRAMTGRPFVWAAWIGGDGLTPELARHLAEGAATDVVGRRLGSPIPVPARGDVSIEQLIERAMRHAHWDREVVRDYYEKVMVYEMNSSVLEGLREFQRHLLARGFSDCHHFPELVQPEV